MFACKSGNIQLVKDLLQNGNVDINYRAKDGKTALMMACEHNQLEVVKLLVNSNVNINQCDIKRSTALVKAIK